MKMKTILQWSLSLVAGILSAWPVAANLAAKVTANPNPATETEPIVFTIGVTNQGPNAALGVMITNRLPVGFSFVRSEPDGAAQGGQEGEEVVIPLGNLPAGGVVSATLTARVRDVPFAGAEGIVVTNKTAIDAANLPGPIIVVLPVPIFVLRDFGDAPDPTYPVLRASNGARHRVNGLYLGAQVDAEPDGLPSPMAGGDDLAGTDDEDGVVFLTPFEVGGVATVQVTASLAGVLDVWADFNADGDWFDAGEHVVLGAAIPPGPSTVSMAIPAWAAVGRCYLRFRLSPAGAPNPGGFINGGEVEDYGVAVTAPGAPTAGTLRVHTAGGRVAVTWDKPNALLQAASTADGPWVTLTEASSPYEITSDASHRFFRLVEGRNASRSGLGRRNFASMAREADLIIDAVVTDVTYRNSEGDGTNDVSWPHTFVTVRVLDVLKGRLAVTNLCLRFLGGLDADGERLMKVSESTRFDVGERSILFVKRNGFLARPLVGGADGRLRVVNGLVYSEHGHRLVLTAAQQLAFGIREELPEAIEDRVGNHLVGRAHSEALGEAPPPERPTGQHLEVAAFKARLAQIIEQNHTPAEIQNPVLTLSADCTRAFQVARPRHRPPPSVTAPVVGPVGLAAAAEDEEVARIRGNRGNPVLPLNP
jgi:uncharacterized repeat protein (TIGR01451 family)